MCTTNVYTYVYPDGHKEEVHQPSLCLSSRHHQPCANNMFFQHPPSYVPAAPVSFPTQMPPSPAYTPRSSTPSYRSGDESDRSGSHRSGNSSSSRKPRSPRSSGVYINGKKVFDLNTPRDRRSSSTRGDRIVLVDTPPTPRTPPQTFPGSASVPNSPSQPFTDPRDYHPSRRPVIVDERLRAEPHLSAPRHTRGGSTSSHDSRYDEEERVRRRQRRQEKREREEQEAREAKITDRIARANARIAKRAAVPVAPTPPRRESTFDSITTAATAGGESAPSSPTTTSPKTGYTRPRVEVHSNKDDELAEAVRRLSFEEEVREDKAQRIAERDRKREEKSKSSEDEAQRRRLMERMQPKRRATVGPGSRRQRVLYDDGVYRWE